MISALRAILLFLCVLAPASAQENSAALSIDGIAVRAEIADTPEERERGLMERAGLCTDCGMLFVFETAARYDFWMKDTPLPLSIAFIGADGRVLNLDEMQPETKTLHSAQGDALYALEMTAGWFTAHGIKRGDKVEGLKPPRK